MPLKNFFVKNGIRKLLFELLIVFFGALGAFTVDNNIQNSIRERNKVEDLKDLCKVIIQDTLTISNWISGREFERRLVLSNRFMKNWLRTNIAPLDSLDLLICESTYPIIIYGMIDFDILERTPYSAEIENLSLKFLVRRYFKYAEDLTNRANEIARINTSVAQKSFDFSNFIFQDHYPKLNPENKGKTVLIDSYLDKELVNRCIHYSQYAHRVKDATLEFHRTAKILLKGINEELEN